ncbi:MAG: hypothetical protein HFH93_03260 [Lachnospiraceae bacterium]|nr:hypothetical protein [Lachnospiraceae bacterium]
MTVRAEKPWQNCGFSAFKVIGHRQANVGLALMPSELHSRLLAKSLQTVFMMPSFLSWAVVTIIVTAFLDRVTEVLDTIKIFSWHDRKCIKRLFITRQLCS